MDLQLLKNLSGKELDKIRGVLQRSEEVSVVDKARRVSVRGIAASLGYPSDERVRQFFGGHVADAKLDAELRAKVAGLFLEITNLRSVIESSRSKKLLTPKQTPSAVREIPKAPTPAPAPAAKKPAKKLEFVAGQPGVAKSPAVEKALKLEPPAKRTQKTAAAGSDRVIVRLTPGMSLSTSRKAGELTIVISGVGAELVEVKTIAG